MGCSGSNIIHKPYPEVINGVRRQPLKSEKIRFNKNHEKFESLFMNADFKEEIFSISEQTDFESFFTKFFSKWLLNLENLGLKREEVKEVILQIATDEIIKENFQKVNCNVNEWIFSVAENFDFYKEEKLDVLKSLVFSANRFYAFTQKAIVLYYPDLDVVNKYGLKPILDNLKYKRNYAAQIFVIWLTPHFLENEETLIDLCEIIAENEHLTTVCILLNFAEEKISDAEFIHALKSLKFLFNTISKHSSVISVLFANFAEEFLSLPLEVVKAFNEMLLSDRLVFAGVSRIIFQPDSLEDLFANISKLKSLKYALLDLKCEGSFVNNFINAVAKNRRLIAAVLGSMSLPENAVEEIENRVKAANPNFKMFHYQKNFRFVY